MIRFVRGAYIWCYAFQLRYIGLNLHIRNRFNNQK